MSQREKTMVNFFRLMLRAYQLTYDAPWTDKMCHYGFCRWLKAINGYGGEDYYLSELTKDLLVQKHDDFLWYPSFEKTYDKEISIKPRIEHLQRTIARLEK